jgi:glycine hydroxymethyltransferase
VSNWIADVLDSLGEETVIARVRSQVTDLCKRFPVYG